jgi:cytochrome c oxidase subunit II
MTIGAVAIFALVLVLLLYSVYRHPDRRSRVSPRWMIIGGGIVFPVVVLSALLAWGVWLTGALRAPASGDALRIHITAQTFWWEVRYLDERGEALFATANEIAIPVGRPVEFALTSRDVIHSFWVPNLAGKIDMIPGRLTRLRMQADQAGRYRGQCAEFCGPQHARMAFLVVALPPQEFDEWLAREQAPARAPVHEKGREAFFAHGCANCHAVRGVSEPRLLGPDLTHVGSRAWIGAGTLPNARENMIDWIARGERVKPGRAMPSFGHLDPATLEALAAFLSGLE